MILSKQKKQVILLYSSTLIGVLLGIITSVINTRVLVPAEYGDVRYVQNIISFVSSILLVGYFTSGSRLLALSKDKAYSRKIRGAMCTILGITCGILGIIMLVLGIFNLNISHSISPLFFVSIILGSNVLFLNYINTTAQGDNHIAQLSIARLLPAAVYIVSALVIFKLFKATPLLMISLYNGINVFVLFGVIVSTKPSFSGLKESFHELNKENKKYGFQVYLGSLAAVSTTYIAGITLGYFCEDNTAVGFYTLAGTMSTPLTFLPSIVGTTYFKKFASQNYIEKKVMIFSIAMTVGSLLAFITVISFVVSILYNDSYSSVSLYASILALGSCAHGMGDMFNRFLGSHGQGKALRNGAFVSGTFITIGNLVLIYYFQIWGAIATSIIGSIVYLCMMVHYYLIFIKNTI